MPETTAVAAAPVARLIDEFQKLPGVGPKSAQRLAYHVLRTPSEEARALAEAILDVKERITFCSVCQNITDVDPCAICSNPNRDVAQICVVEEPLDILALERTRVFKGRYHVLHGVLSPLNGVNQEDLKIRELIARLGNGEVSEVIMAINPNAEGDVTTMVLERLIAPLGVKISRLARGLPVGADLEFADEVTLTRALEHRQTLG
ncbi:MAG: recombination mediator RecR [Dehalococcoidia bacterium]